MGSKEIARPTPIRPGTNRYLKALVHAPPGHGKTRFLGTLQDDSRTSPVCYLEYEGGVETLDGKEIDVFPIRSWDDFNAMYAWLASGDHPYKSIAIDSISEVHIFALLNLIETRSHDFIEQNDYGVALVQMRKLLRSFRDLPIHVVVSATTKEEVDSSEGLVKKPSLAGVLADEVVGIFSVVSYLALSAGEEGVSRVLILQNYPRIRAKVRHSEGIVVPDMITDNPTVTDLLDILQFPYEE